MPEDSKDPNPTSAENTSAAPPDATPKGAREAAASPSSQLAQAAAPPPGDKPVAAASPAPAAAKPAPPKPEAPKPEPWDAPLVRGLKSQYGSGVREACTYAKQNYLVVDSSIAYEILLRLRDDEQFDYCVDITAVHYPKREQPFDIVYILYAFHKNERIRIKTQIKEGERLRSACSLWPTANWMEREIFDMFGIGFDEHPELKRILMPEDWKGHPLRKDYSILRQDTEWVQNNLAIESAQ